MSIHKQTEQGKIFIGTVALFVALFAVLFVAACGSEIELSRETCPPPAILADTETFVALDNDEPIWTAQLGGMQLECQLDRENGQVSAQFLFAGTVGFAENAIRAQNQEWRLPIFVLLLAPDDEIIARRDIVVEVRQAGFGETEFVYEIENINFLPANNYPPNMYQVLIGFQLDPAQLAFNRKTRREKLNL